jgi:hypothetical protein
MWAGEQQALSGGEAGAALAAPWAASVPADELASDWQSLKSVRGTASAS